MPDGGPNAFTFAPAVRENTPMVIALAGASGSGKTFTALLLAMGMADGGKIAVIDTEGRRALHYADLRGADGAPLFRFDHCELRPPFEPARFLAAMKAAEAAGYRVIVIDSFSDEHEGEGGLIDMAAAGTSQNSAANWARPKAAHKLIVRWLRQARCHVIFCLRAEERVRLEKDEKGKTVVIPIGWWPISEKRFMYDMTASFLLTPAAPGVPQPIKLQEQHRRFFPEGRPVERESGRLLAAWAMGGVEPPAPAALSLEDEGRVAAAKGNKALDAFILMLNRGDKEWLKALGPELRKIANNADQQAPAHEEPERTEQDSPAGQQSRQSQPQQKGDSHGSRGAAADGPAGENAPQPPAESEVMPHRPELDPRQHKTQPPSSAAGARDLLIQRASLRERIEGAEMPPPNAFERWRLYTDRALAEIADSTPAEAQEIGIMQTPALQLLRRENGDLYREITAALAAKARGDG